MTPRARRLLLSATTALTLALAAPCAGAADPDAVALARAAYDRGAHAYDAGKYALAAREFTVADELAPSPVALKFAIQAALKIDDPVIGMRLVERATQEGADLGPLIREARDRFARKVGRIALVCPDPPCRARIDGEPAKTITWVTPGPHAIEWEPSGRGSVTVAAGQSLDVTAPPNASPTPTSMPNPTLNPTPDPTLSPTPENSADGGGISPAWFWVGIGLTTIGLGSSVASGVDTLHQHEVFAGHPTSTAQHDGQSAQLRTNVLFGVTGALALATTALGIFAVRWGDGKKSSAAVHLHPYGPGLALTLRQ